MISSNTSVSHIILLTGLILANDTRTSANMNELIYKIEEIRTDREVALYKYDTGSRKCIFFIHGAGGRTDQWAHQINELKDDYNIIAFDFLGHGKSPKPKRGYSFNEISKDVIAVYDVNKCMENIIIAHSYGVAFALDLASNNSAIDKLILIGASKPASVKKLGLWRLPSFLLEWMRPLFSKGFAKNAFHSQTNLEMINNERSISDQNPMFMMKELLKGMRDIEITGLEEIDVPTLIIQGEGDGLTPVSGAQELNDMLVNSELVIVEKASHLVMMEKPYEVNTLIKEFIEKR